MKFHFFISLLMLIASAVSGLIGIYDEESLMWAMVIEFILGCQQILASMIALALYKSNRRYFILHLIFSVTFVIYFLFLKGLGMDDDILWTIVFSVPWAVAIYHTYKLYSINKVE